MFGAAREPLSSIWPVPAQPAPSCEPNIESIAAAAQYELEQPQVAFQFEQKVGASHDNRLLPAHRYAFVTDFCQEMARLKRWGTTQQWSSCDPPELQVLVSENFRISKSLVPAWYGRIGHMEFPAWRVVTGKAAIAHELVHVFFPNANRLLAEGFAVYLQAAIGSNPAFPNFGKPLHPLAGECLRSMLSAVGDEATSLDEMHLAGLDQIATPTPLELKVGQDLYGEEPRGQALIYPLAGSFVQFLIETRGMERFRTLYVRTPLVPFDQDPGPGSRWNEVYCIPLACLEREWKSFIMVQPDSAA